MRRLASRSPAIRNIPIQMASNLDTERRSTDRHRDLEIRAGRVPPPSQAACDRLTAMAARVLGAPAAVLSILDGERPFLLASHGLPEDGREWGTTPLTVSLSHHAGSSEEPFILEDVRDHELLAEDPAVDALGLVSFLGVPLVDGGGGVLGILGVVDHAPRRWSGEEIRNLEDVGQAVLTEIELRGRAQEVRRTERETASRTEERTRQSFLELIHGLDAIISERDLGTGDFTFVSRKAAELLGYPVERWLESPKFWSDVLVHPEDRERAVGALERAVADTEDAELEYRVRTADGETLWLRDQIRVATDEEGSPTLLRGIMVDVTAQKEAARELVRSGRAVRLLQEVAELANEARSLKEPLQFALDRLGEFTGWPVGHVWLTPGDDPASMIATEIWHLADPERYEPFRRVTEKTRFSPGRGLSGRVLETSRPAWIPELAEDGEFGRGEAARESGLEAGFAVPLLSGEEVVGVLEFFHHRPMEEESSLLELAAHVGTILGRVAERTRAQEERERREEQLAEAQRLARLGSWEWDMERDVVTWSDQLYRIFGIQPGTLDLDYTSHLELLPEDDRQKARDAVRDALEKREPFSFEHRVIHPDGEERTALAQGRIVVDDDGAPIRMVGTVQDITERKRLEERARELAAERAARAEAEAAQTRIRKVLESITDAFFAVDREWRLTVLNSEAEELLERDRDDILGRELWEVFPESLDSRFEREYRRAMTEHETVEFEEYYEPLENWFEVRAYPSEDGLSVYLHDINERKRAEQALRESEERYRFLADAVPQQIWTARPDGRYDYVNRVVVAYSGRTEDELTGDGWMKLVHPDDVDEVAGAWSRALDEGEHYETECRLIRHDGEARWHLVRAHPQHGDDGEVLKWFGTSTDIHDQKEIEAERDRVVDELEKINYVLESERGHLQRQAKELRETTRALEKSNRDLDQFAYVASHDLKAPLRGIANLTQWLEEDLTGKLDDDTREYMNLLKGRVHRMEALIDGILQYSRAGRDGDETAEVDTGELVREVVDMLDPPDRFRVEIDPNMPTVLAARTPLQQVFLNLVSNAVKHADGDAPRVQIRCSDEGTEWYEFSVEDNGPGISEEFRDKIWTIFQTLKPRDEVEGTGIGLSVVKRTVEHHGGQVWVESEEGEGATFRFLWPRQVERGEEEA